MFQLWMVLCLLLLIGIDQLIKMVVANSLYDHPISIINGVLEFRYSENTGAAWSLFSNKTLYLILFTSIVLVILLCVLFSGKIRKKLPVISLLLIISGGIGNLIDRIFRGYVIDFIYFKIIEYPIFNIADSFVCVGAVLLLIYVIFFYKEPKKKQVEMHGEETMEGSPRDDGGTAG